MNEAADRTDEAAWEGGGGIRRRHVIYLSGYDPRGTQGFYDLFRRTCGRFARLWPVSAAVQPLEIDSPDIAHWGAELRGASWQVSTRYDFLRLEDSIRSDMAGSALRQMARALGWYCDDVISGAQFRIFRASWRFALHLLCFELMAVAWLGIGVIVAFVADRAVTGYLGGYSAMAAMAGVLAGVATVFALRPLADRWRLIQISSCWSTLRRFARGRPTWLDHAVNVGARHLVAAAAASDADELVVVGHSTGGVTASAIVAQALELDPTLGRNGPRLVLLTLGSVMPAVALHPAADRMRAIVARLAAAPALTWVDCQSRKDVMCFANFDPVDGIGLRLEQRCNPLLWRISFKQMIAPEDYSRFRWSHFRVHYQYIMAGDRPSPYDYILLVGGPMPVADWPAHNSKFMAAVLHQAPRGTASARGDAVGAAS